MFQLSQSPGTTSVWWWGEGVDVKCPGWPTKRTALSKIPIVPHWRALDKTSSAEGRPSRWRGLQCAAWSLPSTFLVEHLLQLGPMTEVSNRVLGLKYLSHRLAHLIPVSLLVGAGLLLTSVLGLERRKLYRRVPKPQAVDQYQSVAC